MTTRRVPDEFLENEEAKALLLLPNTRFRMKPLENSKMKPVIPYFNREIRVYLPQ